MFSRTVWLVALAVSFGTSACGKAPPPPDQPTPRLHFWTTDNTTCTRMAGQVYCFPNKNIDSHSFETDAGAGFLFELPIEATVVADCNADYIRLDAARFPYAHVQANVGEVIEGDTIAAYSERLHENLLGESNSDLLRPLQQFSVYGLDCFRYKPDAIYQYDAMCRGDGGDDPAFFLSCNREGSVPLPGCQVNFTHGNLTYEVSYNKRCLPYHALILKRVLQFVAEGRSSVSS